MKLWRQDLPRLAAGGAARLPAGPRPGHPAPAHTEAPGLPGPARPGGAALLGSTSLLPVLGGPAQPRAPLTRVPGRWARGGPGPWWRGGAGPGLVSPLPARSAPRHRSAFFADTNLPCNTEVKRKLGSRAEQTGAAQRCAVCCLVTLCILITINQALCWSNSISLHIRPRTSPL